MHQQVRVVPALSPPDLAALLDVLYRAGVNLVAAGGGNIELGEEFAFVPEDDQFDLAIDALTRAEYQPRLLEKDKDFKDRQLEAASGRLPCAGALALRVERRDTSRARRLPSLMQQGQAGGAGIHHEGDGGVRRGLPVSTHATTTLPPSRSARPGAEPIA